MKSRIMKVVKRVVFSIGIIYGINVILKNIGIIIPINIVSIGLTSLLGAPGLLSIFAILYITQ